MKYLNFEEIRKASATITGSKGMVPLYIRPDKILLPFRVFPAKVDTDRSFVYVNIKEVDIIDPDKKYLIFKSGQRLDFFDSKNCVLKKMGQSQLLGEKISF